MHQIRFRLGELTALPQTPSWILGVLLLREGRGGKGKERGKGRGKEWSGREGRRKGGRGGREGQGRGRPSGFAPPRKNFLVTPLPAPQITFVY